MSVFQAQPTFIFVGIYGTSEDFQRHQNCRKFKICWKKVVVGKQLKASFIKEFSLQAKQTKCRHVNSTAQGLQDEDNSCGIASSLPAGYPVFFLQLTEIQRSFSHNSYGLKTQLAPGLEIGRASITVYGHGCNRRLPIEAGSPKFHVEADLGCFGPSIFSATPECCAALQ